jgi:hypothetical protein
MQFIHYPLTWAFFLVLLPVLIHLINLMRHRRVRWAAMDFLLQSHKKNRRWVWLKQFLLLLLRMLAIAVVVAMLARLVTRDQWSSFFGEQTTHHYLVLDDSSSMADRDNVGSAYDKALAAIGRLTSRLAEQASQQKLTLLRTSQAAKAAALGKPLADFNAETIDGDFASIWADRKTQMEVSELSLGPQSALQTVRRLIAGMPDEHSVVYLISDFRANDWTDPRELRDEIQQLTQLRASIHFIRCADMQHANLAITEVLPAEGTLAAGVPMQIDVKVRNFGPQAARQIPLEFVTRSYSANATGEVEVAGEKLPAVVIDQIGPGETVTRQTQVRFDLAGQHLIEVTLPRDAVETDNVGRCLIDLPAAIPVLVIDGDNEERNAYYLSSVFAPGRIATGIRPVSQPATYLRDASNEELAKYDAIYLLDTGRLDPRAVPALQDFVRAGGGLAFFAGDQSDPEFLTELYDNGNGLFPLPVGDARRLELADDEAPDLRADAHPIFRALVDEGGNSRPLARGIRIRQYLPATAGWSAAETSSEVIATVRNNDPLVVQKRFGDGRVVAFLTTATPDWNNWALGPSYPVVLLQLHAFLAAPRRTIPVRLVGSPIELQLDAAQYQPLLEFLLPSRTGSKMVPVVKPALAASADSPVLTFRLGQDEAQGARNGETDHAGIYVANAVTLEGQPNPQRFALNPSASEGNLATMDLSELSRKLEPVRFEFHDASDPSYDVADDGGFAWSDLLAGLLIAMLIGEQVLAYSASYHLRPGGGK